MNYCKLEININGSVIVIKINNMLDFLTVMQKNIDRITKNS